MKKEEQEQLEFELHPYHCHYPAPRVFWFITPSGKWGSRAWRKGEKEKYEAEVLGRSVTGVVYATA